MTKYQKAIILVLGTTVLTGAANLLSKFGVTAVGNATLFTIAKNIIAVFLIVALVFFFKEFKFLRRVKRREWLYLVLLGVIGGSIPFLLFFQGLSLTSAVSGAFIHKTMFVWVSLLAFIFLKEKIGRWQILALGLILVGGFLLSGLQEFSFGTGEALVLAATLFWAVDYIIAKKLLRTVRSNLVIFGRMLFGSIILLVYLIFTGQGMTLFSLNISDWGWVLLLAVFLTVIIAIWYRALADLPASVFASIITLGFPVTVVLSNFFVKNTADTKQLAGTALSVVGVILIIYLINQSQKGKIKLLRKKHEH